MKRNLAVAIVLSLAAVLLLGCSGYSTPTTPPVNTPTTPPVSTPTTPPVNTPSASGSAVTISNFSFQPSTLTISAGTTVFWTNNDSTTHTITSDTGVFSSGDLPPGSSFSHTFSSAGSFGYHCSIHPSMKGTIMVQ